NKRTDLVHLLDAPSCNAPADKPLNRTESRFANRLNESFATESGVDRTCSGDHQGGGNDPYVWSGRAMEEGLVESVGGVGSMDSALGLTSCGVRHTVIAA